MLPWWLLQPFVRFVQKFAKDGILSVKSFYLNILDQNHIVYSFMCMQIWKRKASSNMAFSRGKPLGEGSLLFTLMRRGGILSNRLILCVKENKSSGKIIKNL